MCEQVDRVEHVEVDVGVGLGRGPVHAVVKAAHVGACRHTIIAHVSRVTRPPTRVRVDELLQLELGEVVALAIGAVPQRHAAAAGNVIMTVPAAVLLCDEVCS